MFAAMEMMNFALEKRVHALAIQPMLGVQRPASETNEESVLNSCSNLKCRKTYGTLILHKMFASLTTNIWFLSGSREGGGVI